jgi:hypothetical protein
MTEEASHRKVNCHLCNKEMHEFDPFQARKEMHPLAGEIFIHVNFLDCIKHLVTRIKRLETAADHRCTTDIRY